MLQSSFICGSVRFLIEVSECNGDRIKAGQNILIENGLGEHKCIRMGPHTGSSVRIIYEEVLDFSDFIDKLREQMFGLFEKHREN